jgi:hypothetical protein
MINLQKTMTNRNLNISERVEAATLLWEAINDSTLTLKAFKSELTHLAEHKGSDLNIKGVKGDCFCNVQLQPPTPKIEAVDADLILQCLGKELFEKYIAHSHTLRWSEFRNAPQEVRDRFYDIPGIDCSTQSYQVKFLRK